MRQDNYYSEEQDKALVKVYASLISKMTVTKFLTVRLFNPRYDADPLKVYEKRSGDFTRLHVGIIHVFDRILYGARHQRLSEKEKFKYFYRLETVSKRNRSVLPHVHCLMGLDALQMDTIRDCWGKIEARLEKLCADLNFVCDIDFQDHDPSGGDYCAKYPMINVPDIEMRNLD